MCINTIYFQDSDVVAFKPHVLTGECTDINHAEKISPARLDGDGQVLGLVEESRLGHGFCSRRVRLAHEELEEAWHLVVVPI